MGSSWVLRAVAAPERFLDRGGFARILAQYGVFHRRRAKRTKQDLGVAPPPDLGRFVGAVGAGSIADFASRPSVPALSVLLGPRTRGGTDHARLGALLTGAIPFGESRQTGDLIAYFVAEGAPNGIIATMSASRRERTRLLCRGAAELAVICSLHAAGEALDGPTFGLAEEEAVRLLGERARCLGHLLKGTDAQVRAAARALAQKPLDVPPPVALLRNGKGRSAPLAFGPLVEAFFRLPPDAIAPLLAAHARSGDRIVREAAILLGAATGRATKLPLANDLLRRRQLAVRAAIPRRGAPTIEPISTTRRIVSRFDELPANAESFAAIHERDETLLALAELGDRSIVPGLLARATTGDAGAVDMLAALGDRSLLPLLVSENRDLLASGGSGVRLFEAAVVRMMLAVGAPHDSRPILRRLLARNPMTNWRDGLERGVLVRELVTALGELADEAAAPLIVAILESTSQEYRAILPAAAYALGRIRHAPALPLLERLLFSPKEPVTCEAIWAVGAIGAADRSARGAAAVLLERLSGLEPAAEATRLVALAKLRSESRPEARADLRRAIARALWEPAFRQEETSRRQTWGLKALGELASVGGRSRRGKSAFFLDHTEVSHFSTRDDHRVRNAAASAFAAWGEPVPNVRRYFWFSLPDLELRGGLPALHEAVRDARGIFRHNVATRLAQIGDARSVRPLAEATARLFAEPPASTYEYDDAPPSLVAFVRALARLNRPEGNDVLLDGLRSDNPQVRAVIAENAPADERFVPELMTMLADPRSFLRSRAEKTLTSLGVITPARAPETAEISVVARTLEG